MDDIKLQVESCYNEAVDINEILDNESACMISNLADANFIPTGYMIPILLSTCAHQLNSSKIKISEEWCEPNIFFAGIVGYPGTNKSRAISLFRDAIRNVEEFCGIGKKNTRINQGTYFILQG